MKLLALDTSSQAASAALWEDDKLLGECYANVRLTHSQTALPMTEQLFAATRQSLSDVDCFAVCIGPGSFTGLRIGIAAIKGMAFASQKPCYGVSTLEALAYKLLGQTGWICPVLDARCQQVYTALFRANDTSLTRVWGDEALSVTDLGKRLADLDGPVFLVGDGAALCYDLLSGDLPALRLAPPHIRYQHASSLGLAALRQSMSGVSAIPAEDLNPVYLRLPQAERELLQKKAGETT